MAELSQVFDMIGQDGCIDVATSLAMQNIDIDVDIPIYEVFHLKILAGEESGEVCESADFYEIIRHLSEACGGVTFSINLIGLNLLTIAAAYCVFTPNTGMNVFIWFNKFMLDYADMESTQKILSLTNLPISMNNFLQSGDAQQEAMQRIANRLIDSLNEDLQQFNITLRTSDEIYEYYNLLLETGELAEMQSLRDINCCKIF